MKLVKLSIDGKKDTIEVLDKIFSILFFKYILFAPVGTLQTILFCSDKLVDFSVTIGDKILSYKCILSILRISLF